VLNEQNNVSSIFNYTKKSILIQLARTRTVTSTMDATVVSSSLLQGREKSSRIPMQKL